MIIDRLNYIHLYAGLHPAFAKASEWLRQTDLDSLACGFVEIAGKEVFATLAENRLSSEKPAFEAHRRYADIQLILDGKERFLLGKEPRILSPKPGTDFYPCEASDSLEFTLGPREFTVFFPGEAHSPGNMADNQFPVCRKLVVKVLMA